MSFTDTHGDSLTNTTITSVFINSSGHSAIITGTGTWDGTDGYNFTLYVANWSLGKHSLDSFGLVITGQNQRVSRSMPRNLDFSQVVVLP